MEGLSKIKVVQVCIPLAVWMVLMLMLPLPVCMDHRYFLFPCFATYRINFLTKTQKVSYAATASPSKTSDRTRTSNEVFLHPNAVTTPYKHMPIDSRFNHPSIKKSCAFNFYCRLRLLLLLSHRRCRAQYLCSYFASTTPTSRHDHHIILTKPIKHV